MCICIPNMTLVCLTLWLGEVCTDDDDDANDDPGRRNSLVDKPNELKTGQDLIVRH